MACERQLFEVRRQIGQQHIITSHTWRGSNKAVHIHDALHLFRNRTWPKEIRDLSEIEIRGFNTAIELESNL